MKFRLIRSSAQYVGVTMGGGGGGGGGVAGVQTGIRKAHQLYFRIFINAFIFHMKMLIRRDS